MPRVLTFGQYILFFFVGENDEPVHIHVAVKRPSENSSKFWLTSNGGCILANNKANLPAKDLNDLSSLIKFNHKFICNKWKEAFGEGSLKFYL